MEVMCNNYMPGDSRLVEQLVSELKSQGIFDEFRKECIFDVDTKPAYQNLRQRVEGSVATFLKEQTWSIDLNKNQLREQLRKNIHESGFLETGVERIVDQVVNPKINSVFFPKVEEVVYRFLGLKKPVRNVKKEVKVISITDLLPTDLEAISPESVHSFKTESKRGDSDIVNDSLPSSGKLEDESPPFEPLNQNRENGTSHDDKMLVDENTRDSHLSGFSGLESHDSNHGSDNKVYQMELSNQDSHVSQNSSESHLSIITSDDTTKMEICEDSNTDTKIDKSEITSEDVDMAVDNEAVAIETNRLEEITEINDKNDRLPENKYVENEKNIDKHENEKNIDKKYDENEKNIDKKYEKSEDKKSKSSERSSKDKKDDKHKKSSSSSSKEKDKSSSKHSSQPKTKESRDKDKKDSKSSSSYKDKSKEKSEKDKYDKDKDKSSKYKEKLQKDKVKSDKDKSDKDKVHKSDKTKSEKDNANKIEKDKSEKSKDRSDKSKSEKDKSKSEKDKSNRDKDKPDKEKSSKEKDKYKEKSGKSSKSKEKSDKEKERSSKEKSSRDKSNSSKEPKEKNKEESKEVKDKTKEDSKESNKEKSRSSSSNTKHSSGRDKKPSTPKKESSSQSSYKDKSSSSNSSAGDSKSKNSSEKPKKDETNDKHSSSKKDKQRESKKKSKDDHYSSKIKKTDRRSTDRDSNDGQSSKNYLNSYSESTSSRSENNSQDYTSSSFTGGSGDSGNSDQVKTSNRASNGTQHIVTAEVQKMKYIKPKVASNFKEARQIMKIRKQLAIMERQNQLSLSKFEVPFENGIIYEGSRSPIENNDEIRKKSVISEEKENINTFERVDEANSRGTAVSRVVDNLVDTKQVNKLENKSETDIVHHGNSISNVNSIYENPQSPRITSIESTDLSKENWDALEAKLAEVMAEVNYNSYESDEDFEFRGYSSVDATPKHIIDLSLDLVKKTEMELEILSHQLSPITECPNNCEKIYDIDKKITPTQEHLPNNCEVNDNNGRIIPIEDRLSNSSEKLNDNDERVTLTEGSPPNSCEEVNGNDEELTPAKKHSPNHCEIINNDKKNVPIDESDNLKDNIAKNYRRLSIVLKRSPSREVKHSECCYLEKATQYEKRNLRYINTVISKLKEEIQDCIQTMQNNVWSSKRGSKRKFEDHVDVKNNNKTVYIETVKKRRGSTSSNTVPTMANKKRPCNNTDITHSEHFSLPLSPAESDKSSDRKDEDLLIPMKQKRIVRGYSQRYTSDDLYKPRPVIGGRRNKFPKKTG